MFNQVADHIALAMGCLSFLGSLVFWWSTYIRKRYAAERDYAHLKRNYEALSIAVTALDKMLDSRLDRIEGTQIEQKVLLTTLLTSKGSSMGSQ
jgi:hypothetical protein